MYQLLLEYGLFLLKIITVVVAIAVIIGVIANLKKRGENIGELSIVHLNKKIESTEKN